MGVTVAGADRVRAPADRAGRLDRALQRVASGRPHAHAALYDAIGRDVFAVAAVVTGRPAVAGEVVLEAFHEITGTAGQLYRDPHAAARILSITQRLARDRVRRRPLCV